MGIDLDIHYLIHINLGYLDILVHILVKLDQHRDRLMPSMMSHIIVFKGHQIVLQGMDWYTLSMLFKQTVQEDMILNKYGHQKNQNTLVHIEKHIYLYSDQQM